MGGLWRYEHFLALELQDMHHLFLNCGVRCILCLLYVSPYHKVYLLHGTPMFFIFILNLTHTDPSRHYWLASAR